MKVNIVNIQNRTVVKLMTSYQRRQNSGYHFDDLIEKIGFVLSNYSLSLKLLIVIT